jgi:hypothetical protein
MVVVTGMVGHHSTVVERLVVLEVLYYKYIIIEHSSQAKAQKILLHSGWQKVWIVASTIFIILSKAQKLSPSGRRTRSSSVLF